MSEERIRRVTLDRFRNYQFIAEFDDVPGASPMVLDEARPLGDGNGPDPASLLGAAIGNCLASSLVFCLEKARVHVGDLAVHVSTTIDRNHRGRLRITGIDVDLRPEVPASEQARFERCEHLFEDFCIVTASVRDGIRINVAVNPGAHQDAANPDRHDSATPA
jgi:organic hydroperoxide reductase OsmC/OhrA